MQAKSPKRFVMCDTSQKSPRRRWQCSLRKLLLWTVVVAVYLGIARLLVGVEALWAVIEGDPFTVAGWWLFTGGMIVAALVFRALMSPLWAAHLTTCTGGLIYGVYANRWFASWLLNGDADGVFVVAAFVLVFLDFAKGFGLAWMICIMIGATCRLMNWADRRIAMMRAGAPAVEAGIQRVSRFLEPQRSGNADQR